MLSVRTIADIEARRQLRPRRDTLEAILLALAPAQEVRSAIRAAWRALAPSDEIPVLLDPFFGRFVELERIASLLTRERLVTLTGLAGVGKTRLALEALRTPLSRFDRVAFIPLAGASADGDVAPITLARLGGDSRGDLGRSLSAALRGSRPLVILDSAEHVRGGTIELVRRLLELESATVVVTSQVPLGLPGEHLVIVEPLPASDALALLVERAERAGAQVDPSDRVLTDICARLDGLPLAIELAAPKLRTLDAGALLRRLSESDADSLVLTDDMDAPALSYVERCHRMELRPTERRRAARPSCPRYICRHVVEPRRGGSLRVASHPDTRSIGRRKLHYAPGISKRSSTVLGAIDHPRSCALESR